MRLCVIGNEDFGCDAVNIHRLASATRRDSPVRVTAIPRPTHISQYIYKSMYIYRTD